MCSLRNTAKWGLGRLWPSSKNPEVQAQERRWTGCPLERPPVLRLPCWPLTSARGKVKAGLSASSSSPGNTRLIPQSSGNWTWLRVALSAARGCPPATELQRTRAAPQACSSSRVLERPGAAWRFRFPSPPPAAAPGTPGSEPPPRLAPSPIPEPLVARAPEPRGGALEGPRLAKVEAEAAAAAAGGEGGGCAPEGAAGAGAAGGAGGGHRSRAPYLGHPNAVRCPCRPAEGSGRAPPSAHGCVTVKLCLSPCSGRRAGDGARGGALGFGSP